VSGLCKPRQMPRNVESNDHLPPRPPVAPWTASRCNRTLRQLNSFVKRLEKWHKDYLASQTQSELEGGDENGIAKPTEKDGEQDFAWLSKSTGRRDGRTRKGYASRQKILPETPAVKRRPLARLTQRTPNAKAHFSDATLLKTPAATSVGDTLNCGHTARKNVLDPRNSHKQDPRIDTEEHTKQSASLVKRREGIIQNGNTIIVSFLIATSDPKLPTRWKGSRNEEAKADERGAKSLVSMCLAKVSENIVEEQKLSDAKHDGYEGQYDIVGSELEELQDYFGNSETGWPPLRNLTRLCGITMVSRLIESGAFPKAAASDLAIRAFGSPLLADFGEAITEVLMRVDANNYSLSLSLGGGSGMAASRSYTFDEGDCWRQSMQFRWLTQAIRQELNPVPFLSQFVRFHVLVDALSTCIHLEQVAAAELIETTYSRALLGDCQTPQEVLRRESRYARTRVNNGAEETSSGPLTAELDNRLKIISRLFFAFNTEWTSHLLDKICAQVQVFIELHLDQDIPQGQKLIIAQIFFTNMCLALLNGRDVEHSLQTCFEVLLSECESGVRKQIEALLIHTMLGAHLDRTKFVKLVTMMATKCAKAKCTENERLQTLLGRVSSEAAMDYAADQPESDDSIRAWASGIEEKLRIGNKRSVSNAFTPPDVQRRSIWTGYRWDEDVREWIERTPKKVLHMLPGTKYYQLDGARASCLPTKNAPAPESEGIQPTDHGMKRKSFRYDFELHRDDDFEYKKPRLRVPKPIEVSSDASTDLKLGSSGGRRRLKPYHEEESADELSLLE
jgi:hypothetical protein